MIPGNCNTRALLLFTTETVATFNTVKPVHQLEQKAVESQPAKGANKHLTFCLSLSTELAISLLQSATSRYLVI